MRMDGKVVVCIGGAGGMGRGVAQAALELGADVIVTSRSQAKANQAADQLGCRGEAIDIYDGQSGRALQLQRDPTRRGRPIHAGQGLGHAPLYLAR